MQDPEILRTIEREASRLAWRNRWIDPDDLMQEALLTALDVDSRGRWRASENPGGYMARAVRNRLMEMVMRAGCPVKVGIGSHSGGWGKAYAIMSGVHAVGTEQEFLGVSKRNEECHIQLRTALESDRTSRASVEQFPDPESSLDRARALAAIREVLAGQSPAARAVILDELKPAQVARETGLSVSQVYWQSEKARDAVKERLREMVVR